MVRASNIGTEEVEQAVAAIALHLDGSRWVPVDLLPGGERLRHTHPPGCPKLFKAMFQGNHVIKLQVKGKFKCGNEGCRRSWSSALGLLLLTVQPARNDTFKFSIMALEQGCQRCGRDVYTRMYADEAARVAEWMEDAYVHGEFPEKEQRTSHMRRPHDRRRCSACKSGLH